MAYELGLNPIVIDIDSFGRERRYLNMPVMKPLQSAILSCDVAFMLCDQMLTDFGMFLGNSDECDFALLGHSRRFTLEARGLCSGISMQNGSSGIENAPKGLRNFSIKEGSSMSQQQEELILPAKW